MITILPADEVFLQQIGAPDGTDAMVLRGTDDAVEGYALFRVDGDTVEILRVETDEPLMTEGLIRSVLNTGDCRRAVTGICAVSELAPILRCLEFHEKDGLWSILIDDFFHQKCPSEKEKG